MNLITNKLTRALDMACCAAVQGNGVAGYPAHQGAMSYPAPAAAQQFPPEPTGPVPAADGRYHCEYCGNAYDTDKLYLAHVELRHKGDSETAGLRACACVCVCACMSICLVDFSHEQFRLLIGWFCFCLSCMLLLLQTTVRVNIYICKYFYFDCKAVFDAMAAQMRPNNFV